METIYKYTVEIKDQFEIEMPIEATLLTVQIQDNVPYIWAIVDSEEKKKEKRTFCIIGTGNNLWPDIYKYIGTFQQLGGRLVWHLFEIHNY